MTAIADARSALHLSIASASLASWRVHRVVPAQVAAPCIWLDSVELALDAVPGAGLVTATFPVYAVMDGTVRPQVEALDDILAHIWTAAIEAGGDPQTSRPVALDVGGPNLRAHVLRVDMTLTAIGMCAPSLVTSGGIP